MKPATDTKKSSERINHAIDVAKQAHEGQFFTHWP